MSVCFKMRYLINYTVAFYLKNGGIALDKSNHKTATNPHNSFGVCCSSLEETTVKKIALKRARYLEKKTTTIGGIEVLNVVVLTNILDLGLLPRLVLRLPQVVLPHCLCPRLVLR